ncbi:hypothetical protein VNO77_32949 [Canavalia gladiata]|uniref:Uncharacterized protein n=1 Tax=Canavalia gladiata TaxID=3824 RepID=A0AAN9KDF9_CANGL
MVEIKSCEDTVDTNNRLIVLPDEHSSDVSSNDAVSNNINVEQDPKNTETQESLVQSRVSLRLQKKLQVNYSEASRRPIDGVDGNHSIQKRKKLKNISCVAGGDGEDSRPRKSDLLVFDELDFRSVVMLKESLRLFNLQILQSSEQNKNDVNDSKEEAVEKILKTSKRTKYWGLEKFVPGLTVSKYVIEKMRRMAELGLDKVVHFVEEKISRGPSDPPWDLSSGQEAIAIPVTNEYDDPPIAPPRFTYIKSLQIANNVKIPASEYKCQCKGSCQNMKTCDCAILNEVDFPYVRCNGDRLIEARSIVYECGPSCGCKPNCGNKISQKGIKYQLEVYRTPKKGWGVRTWDFIPSGAPVCEYIGVVKKNDELLDAKENDYIFDIDCWQTINGIDGREKRLCDVSLPPNAIVKNKDDETTQDVAEAEFSIDASSFGNIARFINHSCDPNLFVQCILNSHHNFGLARLVLFAGDDIPPYQELTYDYGYKLDSVIDSDGNLKQMPCYCGAAICPFPATLMLIGGILCAETPNSLVEQAFQQLTGNNSILFYALVIFQSLGFGSKASLFSSFITNGALLVAIVISMFLVDKFGRRAFFLEAGFEMICCMAMASFYMLVLEFHEANEIVANVISLSDLQITTIVVLALGFGISAFLVKVNFLFVLGFGRKAIVGQRDQGASNVKPEAV